MPLITNPAVSIKRALVADLHTLAVAAGLKVQDVNAPGLEGVTISTAPIAAHLATYDASVTGAEQALYDAIMADVVTETQALAALPLMIEAP